MNRVELLDALRLVEPALATIELIPALTHLWFRGNHVMAFNDQIAISTPLKCGFEAAVPGKRLMDLLVASRVENVEMELIDEILHLKLGGRKGPRIQLPTLPTDAFVFDIPDLQSEDPLPVDPDRFLLCIENCLRSVSRDASMPEKLGITLVPGKKTLDLYSTDSTTISHAGIKLEGSTNLKRNILSQPFCEQMLRLARGAPALRLEVHEDYSILMAKAIVLFGRLIESEKPLNFNEVYSRYFPEKLRDKLVPIPSRLGLILERARIITDSKIDKPATNISVENGQMAFHSKSNHGEVSDSMKLAGHPDVTVAFNPKFLHTGVEAFASSDEKKTGKMLLTETAAIMRSRDNVLTYLVAPVGK